MSVDSSDADGQGAAATPDAQPDQAFLQNAINNLFNLYFSPELERRVARGEIAIGFQIQIAQVVLNPKYPPIVRFNDEVRLEALIQAPRDLAKGDPVFLHEFGLVQSVELTREEMDCGHATIIVTPLGTQLFFNFRYGRDRAAQFTDAAEEFLETAADAIGKGRIKAALENLHTSAENVALAHLVVNSRPEAHGGTHKAIRSGINLWARTRNINPEFVALYNWITRHREKVRYSPGLGIPEIPPNAVALVRTEIEYLRQHWRWRDGKIELLTRRRPDLVLVKLEDSSNGVVIVSN